ncbi:MAG TPA: quinoprotein relay system zinc metallohydrolase 2 [Hyphomicrobiaceae bacterium]|nr:quinoprotein relay system zinc metallohydrolase 2 [Hyphomicrobiaceae bacterium]
MTQSIARPRALAFLCAALALLNSPPTVLVAARAGADFAVEIAPGVFVHQGRHALVSPENGGDISNCGFVVGKNGVAVVDTCGSAKLGGLLRAAVRAVTDRPIRYVINTHMHPDHVFGNAAFADDAPAFVAHAKLARGLAARSQRYLAVNEQLMSEAAFAGTRIVLPTLAVEDHTTLDLGGRTLELEAQDTAHTDNDLTIRDNATGTVFLGDLLFAEHVPTLDGSIRGWISLMKRLTRQPAQRVVPGHGPPSMPWPAAAKALERYLDRVAGDVRRQIKDGRTLAEAAATAGVSEKGAWLLFEDYHARNVTAAFAELEWE